MGAVATNIVQTASFYNTTGVIEKEHNLYYCPRVSAGSPSAWLTAFTSAVSTITGYSNISISQWSPEDRVLSIKGRIENFRVSSGLNPLNYCIVTQTVSYDDLTTATFYYAYFIVGARQNGVGAVTLELEPDHFTNVFFLQNVQTSDQTYDVTFNRMLKNAYVERQHYDRIKSGADQYYLVYVRTRTDLGGSFNFSQSFPKTSGYVYSYTVECNTILSPIGHPIQNFDIDDLTVVDNPNNPNALLISGEGQTEVQDDNITLIVRVYYSTTFKNENLQLFSNYEESFRFRRQFRDKKDRLGYALTDEEKYQVSMIDTFSSLDISLRTKIIKQSLVVMHYTLKNRNIISGQWKIFSSTPYLVRPAFRYENAEIGKELIDVINFSSNIPNEFKKYENDIKSIIYNSYYKERGKNYYGKISKLYLETDSKYTPYIASCYASKDDEIIDRIILSNNLPSLENSSWGLYVDDIQIDLASQTNRELSGYYLACLPSQPEGSGALQGTEGYIQHYSETSTYMWTQFRDLDNNYHDHETCMCFLTNIKLKREIDLDLSEEIKNTKTNYYEPILLFEPYSFYAISYLGNIEVPFNRRNYYETNNVHLEIITAVTENMKLTVIPTYSINGKEFKFYTDELSLTLSNQVTYVTTELDNYLIQNRAQMKNQYAVNDLNAGRGIITGLAGSTSRAIKVGAFTGSYQMALGSFALDSYTSILDTITNKEFNEREIALNQKSKLADLGNLPNNLKQLGTDLTSDLSVNEMGLYLNHYTIDEVSHNNICKYLERYGYLVNIYDTLHVLDRKGWNYIKLIDTEFDMFISEDQEESIRQIFTNGVTLLHEPSYLHNNAVHNYEIILD